MPSPIGHALGGLAVAWLVGGRPGPLARPRGTVCGRVRASLRSGWPWLAVIAMSPDLDLLFGTHGTYSHSVGATILVAMVTAMVLLARGARITSTSVWLTVATLTLTYGSHPLLDWLGADTTPPFGITALWPFSDSYYKAPVDCFRPVARDVFSRDFWVGNLLSLAWELLLLVPIVTLVGWLRGRQTTNAGRAGFYEAC